MPSRGVFGMTLSVLLFGLGCTQRITECTDSYYPRGSVCGVCPDRCATCISDLNCTRCKGTWYGPICEHTCRDECSTDCQKEYGYCTFGCPDAYHPKQDSAMCFMCPANCKLCKSKIECVECIPGFHGNTCENRCSIYCEKCNKTTGACLVCEKRYFNQDGQCRRCPDGCAGCYNRDNCSRCEESYMTPIGGQCIVECAKEITDAALTSIVLEYIMSRDCSDRKDSEYVYVQTRIPCIQYIPCSSNIICPSEYGGKSRCGTIKTYLYTYSCHPTNGRNTCAHIGTNKQQTTSVMQVCLGNREFIPKHKLATHCECLTESDDSPTLYQQQLMVILIVVTVVVVLIFLATACYHNRVSCSLWITYVSCRSRNGSPDETTDPLKTDESPVDNAKFCTVIMERISESSC